MSSEWVTAACRLRSSEDGKRRRPEVRVELLGRCLFLVLRVLGLGYGVGAARDLCLVVLGRTLGGLCLRDARLSSMRYVRRTTALWRLLAAAAALGRCGEVAETVNARVFSLEPALLFCVAVLLVLGFLLYLSVHLGGCSVRDDCNAARSAQLRCHEAKKVRRVAGIFWWSGLESLRFAEKLNWAAATTK